MMKPKVSIIVPVYNVEPYLEECVDSLRKQTMEEIEIILVDDGSSDGCPAMCDRFSAQDNRVRVIHQENAGVSTARNRGIDEASGDWLMFVDSDDWMEENAVEILYDKALETGCGIVYASFYMNYLEKQIQCKLNAGEEGMYFGEQRLKFLLARIAKAFPATETLRTVWSSIYRKSDIVCNQCYFPAGMKYGEDTIFNLYAIMYEKNFYMLDASLYHYRKRGQSATNMLHSDEPEIRRRYNGAVYQFMEKFHLLEEFRAYYHWLVLNGVFTIGRLYGASARNWKELYGASRLLKQFSEGAEEAQAIRSAKISDMPNYKRKIACWLLKKRLYWAVVLKSYLQRESLY